MRPWAEPDTELLQAINRGEFVLTGFRNRDLGALLYRNAPTPADKRRAAARITRLLTMLRAHKLIPLGVRRHMSAIGFPGSIVAQTLRSSGSA